MTGYRMFLVEAEMWFIEVRGRGSHLFTVALPIACLPMRQPAIGWLLVASHRLLLFVLMSRDRRFRFKLTEKITIKS